MPSSLYNERRVVRLLRLRGRSDENALGRAEALVELVRELHPALLPILVEETVDVHGARPLIHLLLVDLHSDLRRFRWLLHDVLDRSWRCAVYLSPLDTAGSEPRCNHHTAHRLVLFGREAKVDRRDRSRSSVRSAAHAVALDDQ